MTVPKGNADGPILFLSNHGWPLDHGYPLLEDVVPRTFEGGTGNFMCPEHEWYWIEGHPTGGPQLPGLPPPGVKKAVSGFSVMMPYRLLREPYERYLATTKVQTLHWSPTDHANVVVSDEIT
jgi:hypothetical protein